MMYSLCRRRNQGKSSKKRWRARAQDKEGLSETRRKGEEAPHEKRGLQAADEEPKEDDKNELPETFPTGL
jgi:hypothetical protein